MDYYAKYIKYKNKYLSLKKRKGGHYLNLQIMKGAGVDYPKDPLFFLNTEKKRN